MTFKQEHAVEYNNYGPIEPDSYNYTQEWIYPKSIEELNFYIPSGAIYLAGPMTGIKDLNKPKFLEISDWLETTFPFNKVFNPVKLQEKLEKEVEIPTLPLFMKKDIQELTECSTLAIMTGWERSKHASLERQIARVLGMRIYYVGDDKLPKRETGTRGLFRRDAIPEQRRYDPSRPAV